MSSEFSGAEDALVPTLDYERALWAEGYSIIAGIDEAGRGAWAGPVVAAAVVLSPSHITLDTCLGAVRDSKLLAPRDRDVCYDLVLEHALSWGVGVAPSWEIDRVGIVPATRAAMQRALQRLLLKPEYLLIDYVKLDEVDTEQCAMVRGDQICLSIAAASVIAKVTRDREMIALEHSVSGYGLAQHKGYGTSLHQEMLTRLGPSPYHRSSFAPIVNLSEPPPEFADSSPAGDHES